MGRKLFKIFYTIVIAITTIMCVYLLVGSGNDKGLIDAYNNVKPDTGSSFTKALHFLQSYTKLTGDVTLAKNRGLSDDDVKKLAEGYAPGGSKNNQGNSNTQFSGNLDQQVEELKKNTKFGKYYEQVLNVTDGYYWEKQMSSKNGIWAGIKSNTIGSQGCYIYALCQIKSNVKCKIFTTINYAESSPSGDTISCNPNGYIEGWAGNVRGGNKGVGKGDAHIETKVGVTVTPIDSVDKMESDKYYAVYGKGKSMDDKDGVHWRAVKANSNGTVTILPNVYDTKPVTFNPKTELDRYNHYFTNKNHEEGWIFKVEVN